MWLYNMEAKGVWELPYTEQPITVLYIRTSSAKGAGPMNDVQLDLYAATIETGSFSQCAKKYYMAPITVKRRIDALESEIGVKLLERGAHGVCATPAGKALYDKLIPLHEEARRVIQELRGGGEGLSIRIAVNPIMHAFDWPQIIGRFNKGQEHPIDVQLVAIESLDYLDAVRDGRCDVCHGLPELANEMGLFFCEPYPQRFVAIVSPEHPLAGLGALGEKDLASVRIQTVASMLPYIAKANPCLQECELESVTIAGDTMGEVIAFLHGGGCLLVPSACQGTFPGFTVIEVDNLVKPYSVGFITRPNPPEYLLAFLRCARLCRMDQ